MRIFVNACNILAAVLILAAWIRESRKLPGRFVLLMSLRYVRFFLVYALMMNRYNRHALWSETQPGTAPVPYWPLTGAETGVILAHLALTLISLAIFYLYRRKGLTREDSVVYVPFTPTVFFYPLMMPGCKMAKSGTAVMFSACLTATIWLLGFFQILATTLLSLKNVH